MSDYAGMPNALGLEVSEGKGTLSALPPDPGLYSETGDSGCNTGMGMAGMLVLISALWNIRKVKR